MKYVIYVRVSDVKQEDGTSPETQLEDCIKYIGKSKYTAIIDTQKGGIPLARRKKLREAIDELESGDVLLALRADRLSRKLENLAVIKYLVKSRGASVETVDGSLKPASEDPMAFALEMMAGVFAQVEVMNTSIRIRRAHKKKREMKEALGFCAYGFRRRGEKIEADPKQQKILESMLAWRAQGMSYREIVRKLNDEGLYNTRGRPWNHAGVYSVINTAQKNLLVRA